ncbi:hypothetical protein BD289DRAFT_470694 [Coniella lustricola]|uniref:Uncharacterized protein n=1 Tax=Coniella lustricola TaxID=2025994 RepID=A0A2T3AMG3_9PEZI|nr:hypothetical protein BD289DRAFT_470694 [Coniella lustricola]
MVWHASRWHASGPNARSRPQALGQQFHYVDELDMLFSTAHSATRAQSCASSSRMDLLPPVPEEKSSNPTTIAEPPLAVTVLVTFHDVAVRSVYTKTYASSQSFTPTDRICRGLLRRIRHCSDELLTRQDPDALNPTQCILKGPKQLRFELTFEIHRNGGADPWTKASFQSYQKHALSSASAMDLLRSTHTIIAMFMRRHDADFEETEEPTNHCFPGRLEASQHSHKQSLDLNCVPSELYIESSRSWAMTPGYSLELTVKPRTLVPHNLYSSKTVKVDSVQASPMTLDCGEDLLWQTYMFVQNALDTKRALAHNRAAASDLQRGNSALDLELRILNNVGPAYEHLHRILESDWRYIGHPESQYFQDFLAEVQARFQRLRDNVDKELLQLHDFDFRIAELVGHGWRETNCARFLIDGRHGHGRRSIVALLDRIRTGVNEVLRGYDVAIRMIAYKRGHLVLDKALVARGHRQTSASKNVSVSSGERHELIARLRAQIQRDIDMICKDTCSLDDLPSGPPTPDRPLRHSRSSFAPNPPQTPRSIASHRTAPGSPSSFMFRAATPPDSTSSPRSVRAFPLMSARAREKKSVDSGAESSIHGSPSRPGIGEGLKAAHNMLRLGPAIDLGQPVSFIDADITKAGTIQGLKPAAEVFSVTKRPDADTDSISTHSSLPALTKSDTSSPDHSILVTPDAGQTPFPNAHATSFTDRIKAHGLSSSWTTNISAPRISIFPETEHFAEPKSAVPQTNTNLLRRPLVPVTPGHGDAIGAKASVAMVTPKFPMNSSGNDKTPLAHRQMQGPTEPQDQKISVAPSGFDNENDLPKDSHQAVRNPRKTIHGEQSGSGFPASAAVRAGIIPPQVLAETSNDIEADQLKSQKDCGFDATHTDCTASTAFDASIVTNQDRQGVAVSIEGNININADIQAFHLPPVSSSPSQDDKQKDEPTISATSEEVGLDLLTSPGRRLVPARIEHKKSKSRLDSNGQDEEFGFILHSKARISAPVGDRNILALHERARSVSGGPENAGHIPGVTSEVEFAAASDACEEFTSEVEDKNIFSPITDTVFDFGFDNVDSVLEHIAELGGSGWQTVPEVRKHQVCGPKSASKSLMETMAPNVLPLGPKMLEDDPVSVPTPIGLADILSQDDGSAPSVSMTPAVEEAKSDLDDIDSDEIIYSSAESDVQEEIDQPVAQRRVVVLKQKKSANSSIVINKMHRMKSNTTINAGMEQNEIVEMHDEVVKDQPKIIMERDGDFSKLSTALLVVAGLAIASTAVTRYRSSQ